MASTGNLWWTTPVQCLATIGMAVNCGGSCIASPIALPLLQMPSIPAKYQAQQLSKLLHDSEYFFPPCNAICTLANLVVLVNAYLNRDASRTATEKLPFLAAAFGFGVSVTAYTLTVMVPINNGLKASGKRLQQVEATKEKEEEKEFRRLEKKWQNLNYIRAALMITSSVSGMLALLKDGSVVRI